MADQDAERTQRCLVAGICGLRTGSGRLLVRHWPDYRRSVELVIPVVAASDLAR